MGDVDAAGHPHTVVLLDVIEEPPKSRDAPWMADEPHVEPHRHHLRCGGAFLVEDVEGVADEAEPLVGMDHAGGILPVIVGERVGHDQVRFALDGLPERQLLAIVVRVVGKTAFLDQQAARVDAGSIAAIPAGRTIADRLLERFDCFLDMLAFLGFAELEVPHPAPAVAADIEVRFPDRFRRQLVAFQREGTAEHGERHAAVLEGTHDAPEADAAAELEHALAGEIAALHADRRRRGLGEAGFGIALAVLHGWLRALLVVHDEIDRDPGAIGPFRIGRVRAVAHEVARRLPAHVALLTSSAFIWRAMSAIVSLCSAIEILAIPARRQASA